MRNFRLTLCYDGSRYSGWQKQGNTGNTIQEKIEALLTRLLGQPVEIAGWRRTDAGGLCGASRAVAAITAGGHRRALA